MNRFSPSQPFARSRREGQLRIIPAMPRPETSHTARRQAGMDSIPDISSPSTPERTGPAPIAKPDHDEAMHARRGRSNLMLA
jgi:hypothetical protein